MNQKELENFPGFSNGIEDFMILICLFVKNYEKQ